MAKDIGIEIEKPKQRKQNTKTKNIKKAESSAFSDLNFKVSSEFKWEFKTWAASHQMSQKAVLEAAFELIKKNYS